MTDAKKKDGKFELLAPGNAAAEKELAQVKKTVISTENGIKRSGAQMFGYAYLQGCALLRAKEILPHGEFEPWAVQSFPSIARRTLFYRVQFAEKLHETSGAKSATVALLPVAGNTLLQGKKAKLSRKEEEKILAAVTELMDGKGMMEFMRASEFLRPPKKPEYHPPAPQTPEEQVEAERAQARALMNGYLLAAEPMLDVELLAKLSPDERQEVLDMGIRVNNVIRSLQPKAKQR